MNIKLRTLRLSALLAALIALAATAPAALADSEFQAVVAVDAMGVYAQKAPHALLGTLPRGTEVTVKATSGGAALISYGGRTGVAQAAQLTAVQGEQVATGSQVVTNRATRVYRRASKKSDYATVQAGTALVLLGVNGSCAKVSLDGQVGYVVYSHLDEAGAALPQAADSAPVKTGNLAVVTTQQARVYSDAAGSGGYVTVDKGAKLTLLAVRGDCAMVERNGAIGYTSVAYLGKDAAAQPAPARSTANPFTSGTNESIIYAFLTGEMGYNRAAAMGVMANIKYESGYRPVCDGDGGTSYGICQWHAGRKTNLINYCTENQLDYTTLEAQLQFFKYEITGRYAGVHSYLKQVENTADGAYDAGYYFCFNYEAPAARTSQSTKRATYARDTLFGM